MKPSYTSTDLLESLGYGYFEVNLQGQLIYGNDSFFNALGYTKDELLGKHFRRYVDRKHISLMFRIFEMIHKTGLVEKNLPLDFIHKDGSARNAEGSIALIQDENNVPMGFRSILLDITDRKRIEKTLIQDKKKAERELEIAHEIQDGFLVKNYPQPEGWEIATRIRPARQVSGDFYDVFPVSSGNRIAFLIADVCDKGIGAALYMAIFRSLFRAYADQNYGKTQGDEPADALSITNAVELTNNYIATHHSHSNMFATVFFGLLDPSSGKLLYINAGHESPLLISTGTLKTRLDPTGPAVGMLPNMDFNLEQVTLIPGDALILYTDGVTDALNAKDEQFTEDKLIATAILSSGSADARLKDMLSAVDAHTAGREQFDDITLLAVQSRTTLRR